MAEPHPSPPGPAPPALRPGQRDLTIGPIGRSMLLFALPTLGTSFVQSLNGWVNSYWVGRLIGDAGITATANANQVLFLLLSAVFGVGLAATILVGQAMGRRDLAEAKRVVGTMATFFAVLSILIAFAGYLVTEPLLRAMGTPDAAHPLAAAYLRIIFLALPFFYFNTYLSMTLRGTGDSSTPFYFSCLATALDVGLNPLLIRGIGPVPPLGIAGSATATLIGQAAGLLGLLAFAYARRFPIRLTAGELHLLRPDRRLLSASILKGIPMGLQMIVVAASGFAMLSIVNRYGTVTGAAYGIAIQLWNIVGMPALAVGAAASSFAAQNIGANRWDRVERTAWSGIVINLALTGALVLVVYAIEATLAHRFLPHTPAAWPIILHINAVGLWAYLMLGAVFVLFAVVRATGAVFPPLIILTIALLIVRVPAARLLEPRLGVNAVWWTAPISMGVALVLALAYYRFGNWRASRMIAPDPVKADAPQSGQGLPVAEPASARS